MRRWMWLGLIATLAAAGGFALGRGSSAGSATAGGSAPLPAPSAALNAAGPRLQLDTSQVTLLPERLSLPSIEPPRLPP